MDWQVVRSVICDGRDFKVTAEGARVLSDVMMPSGGAVHVHFQSRGDWLAAHDGGAAFDELARHGVEIASLKGVRTMLRETGFKMSDDGLIWCDRMPIEQAWAAIALVADASARAALYMIAKGIVRKSAPLDQRLRDALRTRFPQGRANYEFSGRHRQHRFDFGWEADGRVVLVQAVSPEQSSIAAAIVKGLDAQAAEGAKVIPLFVFDEDDHWTSSNLSMLELGGRSLEIGAVARGDLPLAA